METTRRGFVNIFISERGPHSLGKSVEWKLFERMTYEPCKVPVPTRWGNQLNGNLSKVWLIMKAKNTQVPTRWGNQLNGNMMMATKSTTFTLEGPHSLGK